jgi:hypothetical protein
MRIPARGATNFFPATWEDKELISHNPLRKAPLPSERSAPPMLSHFEELVHHAELYSQQADAERQWVGASNGVRAVRDRDGGGVLALAEIYGPVAPGAPTHVH